MLDVDLNAKKDRNFTTEVESFQTDAEFTVWSMEPKEVEQIFTQGRPWIEY